MGMWHVIESKNPDGDLFKCECGSDKFAYVGGCGSDKFAYVGGCDDSGGMDAAGDCIKCGKPWTFDTFEHTGNVVYNIPIYDWRAAHAS